MAQKKQDYHTTRENNQKEKNTLHSYSTLALPFPISHSLGRVAPPPPYRPPPLSLLLASRVVGPVVEQGVHGVFLFFSILKGGKQWCSWQVSAAGAYVARHCMRGIRDGRTDWAKMKMRERETGGACIHTDKGVFNNASTWLSSFFFAHRLFPAGCVAYIKRGWRLFEVLRPQARPSPFSPTPGTSSTG